MRWSRIEVRWDAVKQTIIEKQSRRDEVEDFIRELEKQKRIAAFDKNGWLNMADDILQSITMEELSLHF
jgi:DNA-binding transcriptional regulator/RsmH inhibitor MraZ